MATFGNFKYKDYMPTTISNHKRSLKKLNKFLNTKDIAVSKIKRRHAQEFKKHLESLKMLSKVI